MVDETGGYETRASGSSQLVALPGTLLSPTIFQPVALRQGWRWAPVDWLHGQGAGDLTTTARALLHDWPDGSSQVLVGHSAGGVIALQVAAELGERLRGLILIDTGASAANHGDPDLPKRLLAEWGDEFIEAFLLRCIGSQALERYGDELRAYAHAIGPERAHRAMVSLRQQDLTERLADIRCPTLIIHGKQDPARQREHALALADGIAGAELCWLDAGHTPMMECPHAIARPLDGFLSSII